MTTNDPVILCYDGSEEAADAIAFAGELLSGRPAIVVAAWKSIIEEALSTGMTPPVTDPAEVNERERKTTEWIAAEGARIASQAGFDAQPLAVRADGPLWLVIELAAEDAEARLIVGATRRRGVRAVLPGNLAGALINHATCAVLVVPSAQAAAERVRDVKDELASHRFARSGGARA